MAKNIDDILELNIDSEEDIDLESDTTYDSELELQFFYEDNPNVPPPHPAFFGEVVDAPDVANAPPPPPPPEIVADAADAVIDLPPPPPSPKVAADAPDVASGPPPPPPPPPSGAAAAAMDDAGAQIEEILSSSGFRHDPSHSCPRCDVANGTPGTLLNADIEGWALKKDPRPLTKAEIDVLNVMKNYGYNIDPCKN